MDNDLSAVVCRACEQWHARRDSNPQPSDPKSDAPALTGVVFPHNNREVEGVGWIHKAVQQR